MGCRLVIAFGVCFRCGDALLGTCLWFTTYVCCLIVHLMFAFCWLGCQLRVFRVAVCFVLDDVVFSLLID